MNQGVHGLEPRSRILTLMALVLSAYLVLLGRLVYWQVWRHGDMAQLAATYHDDTITLPAVRGNILDRNGALLVTNTPVFSIFASPDLISAAERQVIANRLAPVLGLSQDDIQAKLATTRKFVYLARRVPASIAGQLGHVAMPPHLPVDQPAQQYEIGAEHQRHQRKDAGSRLKAVHPLVHRVTAVSGTWSSLRGAAR